MHGSIYLKHINFISYHLFDTKKFMSYWLKMLYILKCSHLCLEFRYKNILWLRLKQELLFNGLQM